MKKVLITLLILIVVFNIGVETGYADGMILPGALSPDYLAVRTHHVDVSIEDNHAVTRVDQEFYNPHPVPVTGRYLFPVPPDAILSRFQVTVDGLPQPVVRQNAAETNAALYETLLLRRDPSLLQYADWETLALDISLPADGSRQMTLEYEEVLVPVGGMLRYRYVLSTERYSVMPLDEASVTVNLRLSSGISALYSPTYPITTRWEEEGMAEVRWEEHYTQPTKDFELFFAPSEDGFGAGLLTAEGEGGHHFLLLFSPETNTTQERAIPKDILFVIDRSGSMEGEKTQQARKALHYILGQLGKGDRFSIVGFDDRLQVLSPTLLPANTQTVADAGRFVERLFADGYTDLHGALHTGLDILAQSEPREASRMMVFLTDGLPTAGVTDETAIGDSVARSNGELDARLHVFGVGYDVNTHLLDRLAADNQGTVTYVQPGESLDEVLTAFYQRIAHPVLTDVEVEFEGMEASEMYPQAIPDLYSGSSLLLAGRFQPTGNQVVVRIRGREADHERQYSYAFDLNQTGNHDFVPRLWATRRVGELLDRIRVEGETEAVKSEVRELGLQYGLVTPYTTFVIQAQTGGAASAENMALYANQAELNSAWGQTTVQARVQNQAYQMAEQAQLASGANVIQNGQYNLASLAGQAVDLKLLQGNSDQVLDLEAPFTTGWIEIDRTIGFGSEAYFELAKDPAVRPLLQSGTNLLFDYQGEVISIQESAETENVPQGAISNPTDQTLGDWIQMAFSLIVQSFRSWID